MDNYHRLIVWEPLTSYHELVAALFRDCPHLHDVLVVDSIEEALPYTCPRSIPVRSKRKKLYNLFFLIRANTYLQFLNVYEFIRAKLAAAYIILHDAYPRLGCAFLADLLHIDGYCAGRDSPDEIRQCVSRVAGDGVPSVTSIGQDLLRVDEQRRAVCGRESARTHNLYLLKKHEWECFRHLVSGGTIEELAASWHRSLRSTKNIMYDMMGKLDIHHFAALFPLARELGFIDGPPA